MCFDAAAFRPSWDGSGRGGWAALRAQRKKEERQGRDKSACEWMDCCVVHESTT